MSKKRKQLRKYVRDTKARTLRSEALVSKFVEWVDSMILSDLRGKIGNLSTVTVSDIDRIFKGSEWNDYARVLVSGRRRLLDELYKLYTADMTQLKQIYGQTGLTGTEIQNLMAPIAALSDAVIAEAIGLRDPLKAEVKALRLAYMASQYTNSRSKIYNFLAGQLKPNRTIKTEFETATNSIYQLQREKYFDKVAVDGEKKYQYLGVSDSRVRVFCSHHLNKIRTKKGWLSISNGQNGNAFRNRGGYNCRHIVVLWLPEFEEVAA